MTFIQISGLSFQPISPIIHRKQPSSFTFTPTSIMWLKCQHVYSRLCTTPLWGSTTAPLSLPKCPSFILFQGMLTHLTSFKTRTPSFFRPVFMNWHTINKACQGQWSISRFPTGLSIFNPVLTESGYLSYLLATCFCKWSFTDTQLHAFVYIPFTTAFSLQQQS